MSKSREVMVVILMSLVTLVFVAMGAYIPLLGQLIIVVIPTWIVFITFKVDVKYVVISFLVMILSTLIIFQSMIWISLIIAFSYLIGIPLGIGIKKGWNSLKTIGIAGLGGIAIIFLLVMMLPSLIGFSYEELIDIYQVENTEMILSINIIPEQNIDEFIESIENIYMSYKILLPSTIIIMGMTVAFMNFFISRAILIERKYKIKRLRKFKYLKLPESFIFGSFLILILSFITGKLNIANGEVMYINIFYLLQIIYAIVGIAVLNFGFAKKKKGAVGVILSVLLILVGMSSILALIGMVDTVIDSRKLRRPRLKI